MPSLQVGDSTWSFQDQGEGDVVVLIHGLASDSRTWDRVTDVLAAHYRVIALDLPGYSMLSADATVSDLAALVLQIEDFLRHLAIDSYALVGHSLGGTLSLLVARENPARCTAVVLIAPGGFGAELNPFVTLLGTRTGSALLRVAYGPRASRAVRRIADAYRSPRRPTSTPRIAEVMETYERLATANARRRLRDGVQHTLRARRANRSGHDLEISPRIPVLILWGADDLVLPSWQVNQAHKLLPWSEVVILPRAGHTPHRSNAPETGAAILAFLASDPVRQRTAEIKAH